MIHTYIKLLIDAVCTWVIVYLDYTYYINILEDCVLGLYTMLTYLKMLMAVRV